MQLLDLKTLAARTCLSVSTVRKMIKMGLPHYRLDRKILVDESECFDWIQKYKVRTQSDPNSFDRLIDQILNGIKTGSA